MKLCICRQSHVTLTGHLPLRSQFFKTEKNKFYFRNQHYLQYVKLQRIKKSKLSVIEGFLNASYSWNDSTVCWYRPKEAGTFWFLSFYSFKSKENASSWPYLKKLTLINFKISDIRKWAEVFFQLKYCRADWNIKLLHVNIL